MAKPRGKVKRGGFKRMPASFMEISEWSIAAWCRDSLAEMPPEQVHLSLKIKELDEFTFALRFRSPDTLGFMIEELARYRREVWPDAEKLEVE